MLEVERCWEIAPTPADAAAAWLTGRGLKVGDDEPYAGFCIRFLMESSDAPVCNVVCGGDAGEELGDRFWTSRGMVPKTIWMQLEVREEHRKVAKGKRTILARR